MVITKSKIANKILQYFFFNKNAKNYINELARILELEAKNTDKKLKDLEREGILKSEFSGNQRYYFLNKQFPLLKQYEEIFKKTNGVENTLRKLFEKDKKIKKVYIYGSYVNKKFDDFSDIDVLIIGNHSSLEIQKSILDIQKSINREINIVNFDEKEFNAKKDKDPFIVQALKNTIKIK